jgi:hypothetical protein
LNVALQQEGDDEMEYKEVEGIPGELPANRLLRILNTRILGCLVEGEKKFHFYQIYCQLMKMAEK